jgi:hypothetical protein
MVPFFSKSRKMTQKGYGGVAVKRGIKLIHAGPSFFQKKQVGFDINHFKRNLSNRIQMVGLIVAVTVKVTFNFSKFYF